jgi:hypothetical protein
LKISKVLSDVCVDLRRKNIKLSELTYHEALLLNIDDCTRHLTELTTRLHRKGIFDMVRSHIKPGQKLSKIQSSDLYFRSDFSRCPFKWTFRQK